MTTATFSPFCKLSEVDGEGVTIDFFYDFAGRKVAEQSGENRRDYSYDSLGRLTKSDCQAFCTIEEHNFADKVTSKRIESDALQFEEGYRYDEAGNRTQLITARGTFETAYNSFGKPIHEKDPLNNVTSHTYHFVNEYREVDTDAKGIQTIRIYDCRGREAERFQLNHKGETLSRSLQRYNHNGNLIEQAHFIYDGTTPIRTVTHQWIYGPSNRIERFIEAGEKKTEYLYDPKGRLQTIVKPSGKQIHHEWDDLGRLARFFSTDFDYHYRYDNCDRVISVYDAHSQTTTTRSYDALGSLVK